jgi:hypothetical protein
MNTGADEGQTYADIPSTRPDVDMDMAVPANQRAHPKTRSSSPPSSPPGDRAAPASRCPPRPSSAYVSSPLAAPPRSTDAAVQAPPLLRESSGSSLGTPALTHDSFDDAASDALPLSREPSGGTSEPSHIGSAKVQSPALLAPRAIRAVRVASDLSDSADSATDAPAPTAPAARLGVQRGSWFKVQREWTGAASPARSRSPSCDPASTGVDLDRDAARPSSPGARAMQRVRHAVRRLADSPRSRGKVGPGPRAPVWTRR